MAEFRKEKAIGCVNNNSSSEGKKQERKKSSFGYKMFLSSSRIIKFEVSCVVQEDEVFQPKIDSKYKSTI